MTRLSVLVGLAAACSLPLSSAPSWAQDVEVVANVPVVSTEGPAPAPGRSVYFTDLANDRILRLGTDGMISTSASQRTVRMACGSTRSLDCSLPSGAIHRGTPPAESLGQIFRPGTLRCSQTTLDRWTSARRMT